MNTKLYLIIAISMALCQLSICDNIEDCQALHNITTAELDSISRDIKVESLPLKFKCYAKCLLGSILGDDGRLNIERALQSDGPHSSTRVEQCKKQYDQVAINNESESCNYAVLALQCLSKS